MTRSLLFALAIGLLVASAEHRASAAPPAKPNIIVILTDDHGWADLGAQGVQKDLRTPHLDALAASGVRATNGYVTAPQCVPSRAGLLTGRYQNRFGVESNGESLAGFDKQTTLAQRLKQAGYVTGMAGKWHLGPNEKITTHGFDKIFYKHSNGPGYWNMNLEGRDIAPEQQKGGGYHLDLTAQFASAFIKRHAGEPFFFYLAFRGPHTPLDAPEKYTARFPGPMPERRRQALAMLSAIDDGVGRVMETLREQRIEDRTLIFFMGDNGAPLKIHKTDSPLDGDAGGWDGSLNAPMNGEKGMLSEGGIRVPWLASWKGRIPAGQVFEHPVISLDVAATAVALAGIKAPPGELDGVNLLPHFTGENKTAPHDTIFWRWVAQAAAREGQWKLLVGGPRSYLFDLVADPGETRNLAAQHPVIVKRLRTKLETWSGELQPAGLSTKPMASTWDNYFDHYLDGKKSEPPRVSVKPEATDWIARNATTELKDGSLHVTPGDGKQLPFLAFSKLSIPGPAVATVSLRVPKGGKLGLSWRLDGQKDFLPEQSVQSELAESADFQQVTLKIPATGAVIHFRLQLPATPSEIRSVALQAATGKPAQEWKFSADKQP